MSQIVAAPDAQRTRARFSAEKPPEDIERVPFYGAVCQSRLHQGFALRAARAHRQAQCYRVRVSASDCKERRDGLKNSWSSGGAEAQLGSPACGRRRADSTPGRSAAAPRPRDGRSSFFRASPPASRSGLPASGLPASQHCPKARPVKMRARIGLARRGNIAVPDDL